MYVNFPADANNTIPNHTFRTAAETEPKTGVSPSARKGGQTDQAFISPQGRLAAARSADPCFELETAAASGDLKALAEAARKKCGSLEVNWDELADPGGKIFSQTYVEALLRQYEKASSDIEAYYADAHTENLTFDNPYTHILQKYKIPDSPYFRRDMTAGEREMAFYQERALLQGSHVSLNDPYALASAGGVLNIEDADKNALQAARDRVNGLIENLKKERRTSICQ